MFMRLNLKHLYSIKTLSILKSYRLAANELCISQPALSKQIKSFEDFHGIEVFIRNSSGVDLSDEGKKLIDEINTFIDHAIKLEGYISQISEKSAASLHVGFGTSSKDMLPNYLREFNKKISITLYDLPSFKQEEQLISGLLDIGFMRKPISQDLDSIKISSDELVFVLPKGLLQGESIDFYLKNEDLLLINDSGKSQMNRDIMNAISSCEYKKRFIKTDIETIITLVSSNTGFTILPKKSIKDNHKDIIIIPFEHDTSFDLFLVWNKNRNFKPINDFIHYMKNKIDYL